VYNKCVIIGGEKMNYILSMDCKNLLQKQNINLKKAELNEIDKILEFYKQTSLYTDLGLYKDFAKKLTNDIDELCVLQRMQIIHPIAYSNPDIRKQSKCFW